VSFRCYRRVRSIKCQLLYVFSIPQSKPVRNVLTLNVFFLFCFVLNVFPLVAIVALHFIPHSSYVVTENLSVLYFEFFTSSHSFLPQSCGPSCYQRASFFISLSSYNPDFVSLPTCSVFYLVRAAKLWPLSFSTCYSYFVILIQT
jgi:hypothetical protein